MPRNSRRLSARYAAQAQHDASLAEYYANRAEQHADMAEYYGEINWRELASKAGGAVRKGASKFGDAAKAMRDSYRKKMAARAGASYYGNRVLSDVERDAIAEQSKKTRAGASYYGNECKMIAGGMRDDATGMPCSAYYGNECKMIAGGMRDDATGMPCSEYYGNLEGAAYDQCLVKLGKAIGPDGSRMPISERKSICKSQ